MIKVDGGVLVQGSVGFYPEEQPVHEVEVPGLIVDEFPVTNAEFRRFVEDTGHVTVAEQPPPAEEFPGADPADLVAGSLVFTPTAGPVPLDDWRRWWRWQPGADWRHPEGPDTTVHGRELHPVVHVAYEDALSYAAWIGKRLPSEAEWEYAARGGLVGARYTWGDEFMPGGRVMANTWHGQFPWRNALPSGQGRTSAVGTFPPNGYGLYDMAGNVWEWTSSPWTPRHAGSAAAVASTCCAPSRPEGERSRRVIKGGSHLCAPSYCHRYRPAARQGQEVRSSTGHVGFRCVVDA